MTILEALRTTTASIKAWVEEKFVKKDSINYPVESVNGKTGIVTLSASDVGALPADTNIPSINGLATETYVDEKVAGLVDSAPTTLDTLNELAAALGDDPNFATTIVTQIGELQENIESIPQSDWDQNDSTQLDYIKNRTHWDNSIIDDTVNYDYFTFSETTNSSDDIVYQCTNAGYISFPFGFSHEKEYDIVWNDYSVTHHLGDFIFNGLNLNYFGNLSLLDSSVYENTGEPFFIMIDGDMIVNILSNSPDFTIFSITGKIPQIHKLDEKFIPDAVVSDWEQNDSTQLNYIKNRTHYDNSTITEIVPSRIEWTGFNMISDYLYGRSGNGTVSITAGSTYKVDWDGTEYELVCQVFNNWVYVGNVNYLSDTTGGDIPFVIGLDTESGDILIATESSELSHHIGFYEVFPDIKQLDEKFIPDTIARVSDTPTEASDFGIYVQDVEPTDAVDGDIWIDTANDPTYTAPAIPEITEADNGKVLMVVNGSIQLVDLNLNVDASGVLSV